MEELIPSCFNCEYCFILLHNFDENLGYEAGHCCILSGNAIELPNLEQAEECKNYLPIL